MHPGAEDIHRLALLVRRILDAEFLLEEEGAALLAESDAACRSIGEGNEAVARTRAAQLARNLEALVGSGRLAAADARGALEVARRIFPDDSWEAELARLEHRDPQRSYQDDTR
jgi:hypothetical protein